MTHTPISNSGSLSGFGVRSLNTQLESQFCFLFRFSFSVPSLFSLFKFGFCLSLSLRNFNTLFFYFLKWYEVIFPLLYSSDILVRYSIYKRFLKDLKWLDLGSNSISCTVITTNVSFTLFLCKTWWSGGRGSFNTCLLIYIFPVQLKSKLPEKWKEIKCLWTANERHKTIHSSPVLVPA